MKASDIKHPGVLLERHATSYTTSQTQEIDINLLEPNDGQIKGLPKNPRFIKGEKFKKLVRSIQDDPEMLNLRECIVIPYGDMYVVIAGNMRYRACRELKHKTVPCKVLPGDTTIEKLKAITIKDNVSYGEHDFEELFNAWDTEVLEYWGLDLPKDVKDAQELKDIPDEGEIEFAEELLLEHNYVVLYFDNALDWEVAQEKLGLRKVKTNAPEKSQKVGIGRVIAGAPIIERL